VVVTAALQGKAGGCPVVEMMGNPSPCFYRIRELLYYSSVAGKLVSIISDLLNWD
jgi:hypothetical protein